MEWRIIIDLLEQSPLKRMIRNNLHRKSKLEKASHHSIDNLLHLQRLQRDQNIEARVASHHRENRGATQIRGGIHVHHSPRGSVILFQTEFVVTPLGYSSGVSAVDH